MRPNIRVTILGVAQDGGVPHPGCDCPTCEKYSKENLRLSPTSLSIIDGEEFHLIDVSRDLDRQMRKIGNHKITDIWLTHGHLGHIDGLGLFGKEVMNSRGVRVHASDSMIELIQNSPKWKKLIEEGNFIPCKFESNKVIQTSSNLSFTPIQVPHRDELTDTHAFKIGGPTKSILHLPDHDSWEETLEMVEKQNVRDWFDSLDIEIALLDGTFWSENELIQQKNVPHPPVLDTLERLGDKSQNDTEVYFIHFNHTNPLLSLDSVEKKIVTELGWNISKEGVEFLL